MKTLYDPAIADDIRKRIATLAAGSARQWGKMNAAQMAAHCAVFMEAALADIRPKRMFLGRLFGPMVKYLALRDEKPMGRNLPTVPGFEVEDDREFLKERERLATLVDRFARGGPAACSTHPHSFFGRLTAEEWGRLVYKHLDHHLRQFGV
ncbi:MAG TPA: DUF1569 domain-containing protein [Thermoanaerobaculia bacterium]|nr:DUF1569 domain-containing protein [Thermoanaerobaculia bacterium]